MVTFLMLFSAVGLGLRSAWYGATENDSKGGTLWGLATCFLGAFVVSSVLALGYCLMLKVPSGFASVSLANIVKIVLFTSVAWPAAFLALLTCLGATRASFLDWGSVPVFGLITTFYLAHDDWLRITRGQMHTTGLMVCICLTAVGIALILRSSSRLGSETLAWWPPRTQRTTSLLVGTFCALVSSCAGLLAIHFVADAVRNGMPPLVVLPIRLSALFPVTGLAALLAKNQIPPISKDQVLRAIKFAALTVLPLFALFEAKLIRPSQYTAAAGFWLATVPVWVFAFEIWPLRSRKANQITRAECTGMVCILASALFFELLSTHTEK